MNRLQEYIIRKEFGLSKREMLEEPMEDISINMEITKLAGIKERREQKLIAARSKQR